PNHKHAVFLYVGPVTEEVGLAPRQWADAELFNPEPAATAMSIAEPSPLAPKVSRRFLAAREDFLAHSNVASARIAAFHLSSNGFIMNFILQPWQFLLIILAGWVHRQQQRVIDYLRTENQVLREKLGKK